MAWITVEEEKAYIRTARAEDDAIIEDKIDACQELIEDYLGMTFTATAQTRYFGGTALRNRAIARLGETGLVLHLDKALLTITSLTNADGMAIAPADYRLLPWDGPPYREIELLSTGSWAWGTDGRLAVVGDWRDGTAPTAATVEVLKHFAAIEYRRMDNPGGDTVADVTTGLIRTPRTDGIPKEIVGKLDRILAAARGSWVFA